MCVIYRKSFSFCIERIALLLIYICRFIALFELLNKEVFISLIPLALNIFFLSLHIIGIGISLEKVAVQQLIELRAKQ